MKIIQSKINQISSQYMFVSMIFFEVDCEYFASSLEVKLFAGSLLWMKKVGV
jgi:hypothetical protein